MTPGRSFALSDHLAGHLSAFGHWIVFGASRAGEVPDTVMLLDRTTGAVRQIAKSAWTGGQTDWVEGTDGWVFWTDESAEPSDDAPDPAWTLNGMDIASGRIIELDHSDSWASFTPIPRAGNGYVAWHRASNQAGTSASVWTFTPRTGAKRQVGTGKVSAVSPTRSFLLLEVPYVSAPGVGLASMSLSTGVTTPLLAATDAIGSRASDDSDLIAWVTPSVNDPTNLEWQVGLDGRPQSIVASEPEEVAVGDGFIAFNTGDVGITVVNTANPTDTLTVSQKQTFVPCRIAASGNTVAWCDQGANGRITIRTAKID